MQRGIVCPCPVIFQFCQFDSTAKLSLLIKLLPFRLFHSYFSQLTHCIFFGYTEWTNLSWVISTLPLIFQYLLIYFIPFYFLFVTKYWLSKFDDFFILQSNVGLCRFWKTFDNHYFRDSPKQVVQKKYELIPLYSPSELKTKNINNCF